MRRAARASLEAADRIGADARELGQMLLRYARRDAVFLEQVAEGRRARNRHAPESSSSRGRFFLH